MQFMSCQQPYLLVLFVWSPLGSQHVDLDSLCIGKYAVLKEVYEARCHGAIIGFLMFVFSELIFLTLFMEVCLLSVDLLTKTC